MRTLPLGARVYTASVIGLGAYLAIAHAARATVDSPELFVVLLLLSCLTSSLNVSLPLAPGGPSMPVPFSVDFASLLLLGPFPTVAVGVASAWARCTFRQPDRPLHATLFAMSSLAVTISGAGLVYQWLGGVPGHLTTSAIAGPLVGATLAFFAVSSVLTAASIALAAGTTIWGVWRERFMWDAPSYMVGAAVAAIAAAIVQHSNSWLIPLALAPLYLTYRAYRRQLGRMENRQRHVQKASDLHLATIEALARAIDAKDQMAQGHIRRVQVYAEGLARALRMRDLEIEGVRTAALLHDIGKLAIPEHILSKPGPLTPEEFQKVREHPRIGADIIAGVPFPYPVAPLILSHHERWDGRGYPSGLKGDDIPLGARILSVVDYFDALMAERPYHKAMSAEGALVLLQQEAGKALDPAVVHKFVELYPALAAEATARQIEPAGAHAAAAPAAQRPAESSKGSVFDNIALAHREIYALYEIAQAMGSSLGVSDTMALISSKLTNLVPFSCCALFLHDEESDTLRCRYSSGVDSDVIRQIVVHSGDGLTGWVARNRRPLLNARPSADLDAAGLTSTDTRLQSALVCPLIFGERFIGTLSVYHVEPAFYTEDHRRLLDRISEQAAAVINNSIVFEQTQEDSLTDALTGLPNTRFLFMHLTRELARAERLKAPLALLVMDLDDFKEINDNHGHHVGDRALCEVARVLRAAIRPYDICVRYAGDEFIVVLSGCGAEEAEAKRVELQAAIEDAYFEARAGKRITLGVSIGAAVFPQDGEAYETLLASADSRMYQDKTRRKRRGAARAARQPGEPTPVRASDYTDHDLHGAAAGVL
jgi:diguanylate cyclase (GGDEF)-like protein/putative nucleotidyltransferase with HDIG domain